MKLRVGTRGSDLALAQTRWVVDRLRERHASLAIETVVIQTQGDVHVGPIAGEHWPIGGFVGAIERALIDGKIDLAVHSLKDLPTNETPGLAIVAVPVREVPNDVLVSAGAASLEQLPPNPRIGTGSPRRSAQLRAAIAGVQVVPIRGNVPTRLAKVDALGLDGVVLAAAGLNRLGISPPHAIMLQTDRFAPAPGQGALAVQMRDGDDSSPVRPLDHAQTRRAVLAERSFLRSLGAGCQTPAGALAVVEDDAVRLFAQLFSTDGNRMISGKQVGPDPTAVGEALAERLARNL